MSDENEKYLGDGLYASFDGWQIGLRAPRADGDHLVYLEPAVFESLVNYGIKVFTSPQHEEDDQSLMNSPARLVGS